eukprot:COSAG02_NODE_635_length_19251_cov_32.350982_15_plen_166_part_00
MQTARLATVTVAPQTIAVALPSCSTRPVLPPNAAVEAAGLPTTEPSPAVTCMAGRCHTQQRIKPCIRLQCIRLRHIRRCWRASGCCGSRSRPHSRCRDRRYRCHSALGTVYPSLYWCWRQYRVLERATVKRELQPHDLLPFRCHDGFHDSRTIVFFSSHSERTIV